MVPNLLIQALERGFALPSARFCKLYIAFCSLREYLSPVNSENTTDTQREGHENDIISAVRVCLVDESSDVRVAAAQAFDVLQEYLGNKAIDQTIPTLLEALRRPGAGSGTALQALREIMTVSGQLIHQVRISYPFGRCVRLRCSRSSSPHWSLRQ